MVPALEPVKSLRRDEQLRPLIEEHGVLSLEPAEDPFRRLIVSIVNQQLSSESAAAIRDRLFEAVEVTPESLLSTDRKRLREAGLSRQKIDYVQNAAEAFVEGRVRLEKLESMEDEAVIEALTSIRGVGVWTAKMFLIFVLAREDVFPVEDLGIRRGMKTLYGRMDRTGMVEKARDWEPHRSLASLYLWRVED